METGKKKKKRILNALIWREPPIIEIFPEKSGATPINMSFALTALLGLKNVLM